MEKQVSLNLTLLKRQKDVWCKMKFRSYSYSKKSVDVFLNKIKEHLVIILLGSRDTQMKNFMPSLFIKSMIMYDIQELL